MREGRLRLRDGRELAFCEYGPHGGVPVFRFQGTPSSRRARHPHEEFYARHDVRLIIADRPGYGASSRLVGRGVAVVADDVAALLDHLRLDSVHIVGASGGGPHALALAALHGERVRAASIVVGAAPTLEDEVSGLVGLNREAWYAAREGWEALHALLRPARDQLVQDPLGGMRSVMATAPDSDKRVMNDPAWQRALIEDMTEALRPGAEGWTDESMLLLHRWDFDPRAVACSVTWWHGDQDANMPLSAVHRLTGSVPRIALRVWPDAGHFESYFRHDEIMAELLAR